MTSDKMYLFIILIFINQALRFIMPDSHQFTIVKNIYFFTKRTISDAASKKAPTPKLEVELASTICPGIAFSPIG